MFVNEMQNDRMQNAESKTQVECDSCCRSNSAFISSALSFTSTCCHSHATAATAATSGSIATAAVLSPRGTVRTPAARDSNCPFGIVDPHSHFELLDQRMFALADRSGRSRYRRRRLAVSDGCGTVSWAELMIASAVAGHRASLSIVADKQHLDRVPVIDRLVASQLLCIREPARHLPGRCTVRTTRLSMAATVRDFLTRGARMPRPCL